MNHKTSALILKRNRSTDLTLVKTMLKRHYMLVQRSLQMSDTFTSHNLHKGNPTKCRNVRSIATILNWTMAVNRLKKYGWIWPNVHIFWMKFAQFFWQKQKKNPSRLYLVLDWPVNMNTRCFFLNKTTDSTVLKSPPAHYGSTELPRGDGRVRVD